MVTTKSNTELRSLVFQDGSSQKFWRIELDGNSHTVCFGRVGTNGQTQTKDFDSDAATKKSFDRLVTQKLKKGYSDEGAAGATSKTTVQSASIANNGTKGSAAKSNKRSASNAIEANGSKVAEACITAVTRTIELEPEDWFRARYRPRQKLERGEAQPFVKQQCVELLSKLKTTFHGWDTKWSGLKLPAAFSKEEAHFWLVAMTKGRDRDTKMSSFAATVAKQTTDGKLSLVEAHKLVDEAPRGITEEVVFVLANLFSAEEVVELMLMESTGKKVTWHELSDWKMMLGGFNCFVVPYLSEKEVETISKRVAQELAPKAEADQHESLVNARYLAASLGMHKEVLQITSKWEDDYFQEPEYMDTYQNPQLLVIGLGSSEFVESEWRRLKLRMRNPEHVRAFLACTEYAALDVVADCICQQTNREECEKLLKVLLLVQAPEAAEPILRCKLECKAPALARDWLETNVGNAVHGLIETAGGRGKLADVAVEYLRSVKRRGLEQVIANALKKAGKSEAAAKVRSDVLDREEKVYEPLDAKSTPKWLKTALSKAVSGKEKLPSWATAANLPPLIVGDKRLNDEHVNAVLHTLAATNVTDKNELLSTLRDKIEKNIRDDFTWKLFQYWQDDGGSSKKKWAMGAIGHLGDDGCVLKLTPLIRVWPGESQHQRAVFGLECLRAIGSSVALMQLSGIAQKLKFKGLKSKAEQFVNEIAKEKGMTRDELEDRVVPDCGLDENGKRAFSFGSRRFSFVLGSDLKANVRDESGKIRTDLPKPSGKDDEAIATASVAEWKLLKKQIKDVATIQSRRLENAMITGRRWSQSDFETLIVKHPLMTHLAQKLIWATFDTKGKKTSAFRLTEEKDYANATDDAFTLPKHDQVGLVHALELTDQERATWGEVLSDYEIVSPFAQLARDAYSLEKGEDKTKELRRFKGLKLAAQTRSSAEKTSGKATSNRRATAEDLQRPAAEILYADQLQQFEQETAFDPKPPGWRLSPQAVLSFVLGDEERGIPPKFVGRRSFLERCIVSLATNRGLMLIGEPGTAKSYLSELLAAAISGDSTLMIQGSAGTTEDNIRYSWNYALLVAEGPSEQSLVPAPLYTGMKLGKLVRFEEITRCPLEIQDVLLSVLSDRVMAIPELHGSDRSLFARAGFNIIATANTRDRGVNEMSAALKRRFNFETVAPIAEIQEEMALVEREANRHLAHSGVPVTMSNDLTEILVTTFRELRQGKTTDGRGIESLSTVLSTAEAVGTACAAGMHSFYYGKGEIEPVHLVQYLLGSVLKDNPDDLKKVQHYFNNVVKRRKSGMWTQFYDARHELY